MQRRRSLGQQQSVAADHGPGLCERAQEGVPAPKLDLGLLRIVVLGPFLGVLIELQHVMPVRDEEADRVLNAVTEVRRMMRTAILESGRAETTRRKGGW